MNVIKSRLWFFQWSCMDVRVGLWRKLSAEELMLLNCGVEEDSWEFLDCKEIQPVRSKGDQPWDFFGRNDAKAETPVLWPPHTKSWLIGKDWCWEGLGQEEKGTTEDEMGGWHHRLEGRESEWTSGVSDGQGGLACCDSWGRKESDTTERLNWTEPRLPVELLERTLCSLSKRTIIPVVHCCLLSLQLSALFPPALAVGSGFCSLLSLLSPSWEGKRVAESTALNLVLPNSV